MKKPEASFLTFTTLFKTGPNTKKKNLAGLELNMSHI